MDERQALATMAPIAVVFRGRPTMLDGSRGEPTLTVETYAHIRSAVYATETAWAVRRANPLAIEEITVKETAALSEEEWAAVERRRNPRPPDRRRSTYEVDTF